MNSLKKGFISYNVQTFTDDERLNNSLDLYKKLNTRRSVRHFSDKQVDRSIIENIIKTASTAPSGAHKQPWTFCAVSDIAIKKAIRQAAEKEEFENYHGRMSERWKKDLEVFETDWNKPFLEIAPWLIIVFKQTYGFDGGGEKANNYYVNESVGLACGMLLTAIHNAGLASLTHTPSPMNFLIEILNRPKNEKPFLLIPVGFPTEDCQIPNITRKPLDKIAVFYE